MSRKRKKVVTHNSVEHAGQGADDTDVELGNSSRIIQYYLRELCGAALLSGEQILQVDTELLATILLDVLPWQLEQKLLFDEIEMYINTGGLSHRGQYQEGLRINFLYPRESTDRREISDVIARFGLIGGQRIA